jgi:sensor histidine kinase YesM
MKSFIFSNKIVPRLARHLVFWGFYFILNLQIGLPNFWRWGLITRYMLTTVFLEALRFLPIYLLAVYSAVYLILPIYLRKRRLNLLFGYAFVLFTITIPASYYVTEIKFMLRGDDVDALDIFAESLQNGLANLITITGAAVIIKIMKDHWLHQRENELLAIENIRNKLHLLKMQMHPRILFASLQRIYLAMDDATAEAPEMILKLSDLLSYLLYESESDQVQLSKEIQMMENYLVLKKLEYKQEIDIQLVTNDSMHPHWITPGLFLPLLEIGLERRAGIKQQTSVTVQLRALVTKIHFNLSNDMPGETIAKDPVVQATLRTVRERLRSTSFQRSRLDLQSTPDSLTIIMQLERKGSRPRGQPAKTAKI